MKRLAIFVEGLTEQILVRHLLQNVLDRNRIAVQTVKVTGGHNVRMSMTVMRAAHVDSRTEYYVLVYDCGGETNVKSYLLAHRDKLVESGYSMILGLRDVYPSFAAKSSACISIGRATPSGILPFFIFHPLISWEMNQEGLICECDYSL